MLISPPLYLLTRLEAELIVSADGSSIYTGKFVKIQPRDFSLKKVKVKVVFSIICNENELDIKDIVWHLGRIHNTKSNVLQAHRRFHSKRCLIDRENCDKLHILFQNGKRSSYYWFKEREVLDAEF